MKIDSSADDMIFIAPLCAKGAYWINNIIICGAGAVFFFFTATSIFRAASTREDIAIALLLTLATIFGTILALIANRIAYECIVLFFEYLRVMKQMRDGQDTIMETTRAAVAAMKSLAKDVALLSSSLRKPTGNSNREQKKSENVRTCPSCGQNVVVPDGIVSGQNIRCPYCNNKFQI